MADTHLFDLAAAVLAAVRDGYPAAPDPQALPDRAYVSDGLPAWDCEQVTVRVVRTYPIQGTQNVELAVPFSPLVQRAAELEIQIVRCSPTVDTDADQATIPTVDEIEAAASAALSDAEMIPAALLAAYRAGDLPGCGGVSWGGWTSDGPEGGLSGGTTIVRLVLD